MGVQGCGCGAGRMPLGRWFWDDRRVLCPFTGTGVAFLPGLGDLLLCCLNWAGLPTATYSAGDVYSVDVGRHGTAVCASGLHAAPGSVVRAHHKGRLAGRRAGTGHT